VAHRCSSQAGQTSGTLQASCAEHVLDLFESARPEDPRPRHAIEQARAWARGEITMPPARTAAGRANAAARDLSGAARHAAHAAGQAAAVAHASSFLVRSHHHDPRDRQHHRLHRRVGGAGRDIRPGAARSRLRRAWQALLRAWLDVFGDVRKRG
jgi:hypothetical protein